MATERSRPCIPGSQAAQRIRALVHIVQRSPRTKVSCAGQEGTVGGETSCEKRYIDGNTKRRAKSKVMKTAATTKHRRKFEVIAMTRQAQAAMMTLAPGGKSDEELTNEHPQSEQWLYVIDGVGKAIVVPRAGARRNVQLTTGSLIAIEKGERHQIFNTGKSPLRTINFYIPPAYSSNGELRK